MRILETKVESVVYRKLKVDDAPQIGAASDSGPVSKLKTDSVFKKWHVSGADAVSDP